MRDHPSIEIKNGKWRWYSQGLYGKTALDYLINVRGYGFVEAVCKLLDMCPQGNEQLESHKSTVFVNENSYKLYSDKKHIPLNLPRRHNNNDRVIAYLLSRGIDKGLITDCISRGDLYESAIKHDCVFKGRDVDGNARYAAIRATSSSF